MNSADRITLLLFLLAALCLAAKKPTSTSAPATNEAAWEVTPEFKAVHPKVVEMKSRLANERELLAQQIADSPEVKQTMVELNAATVVYEKAKQSGSMSDRMAASAAANKVREKLNAIKAKIAAASGVPNAVKDVEAAEKDVADAKVKWEQEQADEAAAAAKAAMDPQYATLKQAVKEHRVLVGMTEEQVKTAWPDAVWVPKAADENGKTYEVTNPTPPAKEVYDLTFQGGKLTFVYRP